MTEGQTQSKQSQELYAQDGELNIVFNNNDQRIKSITILDDDFIKTRVQTKMNYWLLMESQETEMVLMTWNLL